MIKLKTPQQIKLMAKSGEIAASALDKVLTKVTPGITTLELDKTTEECILELGAESAFKKVKGYFHTICTSVNDEVVHGIPSDYKLRAGDVIGIDLGAVYQGYFSDMATTVVVPGASENNKIKQFLSVGNRTLDKAIARATIGNRVGDISHCIQSNIEESGYSVVRELTGHGIGTYLHEDPNVPGVGKKGTGEELQEGMVLAIEVIYNMGSKDIAILDDDWTIVTKDAQISGLFEHTVAVTRSGPVVLTKGNT